MKQQPMGNEFIEWAEVYFSKGSENLDKPIDKLNVKQNFDTKNKFSTKGFTMRLRAFCATHADYIEAFNPQECKGYDPATKRIIRRNIGETREYIYIKTYGKDINNNID